MFLAYDLAVLPLGAFTLPRTEACMEVMDWTIRIYWTADIGVNCITAVFVRDVLQTRMQAIFLEYAKSWLAFDLLLLVAEWATVLLGASAASNGKLVRGTRPSKFTRLLRYVRLLRVMKAGRLMQELKKRSNNSTIILGYTIARLIAAMSFVIH